jgi:hypothetical protein
MFPECALNVPSLGASLSPPLNPSLSPSGPSVMRSVVVVVLQVLAYYWPQLVPRHQEGL